MARLPWPRARQRRSRRGDQNRLGQQPAERVMAPADWAGLVVVRRRGRSPVHAGTTRRRRDRIGLRSEDRRTCVDTSRRGAFLGIECRRRVRARHLTSTAVASIHSVRREFSTRSTSVTVACCGRVMRQPTRARRFRTGASRARHSRWVTSWLLRLPDRWRPTTLRLATCDGSAPKVDGATAPRTQQPSTESSRSCS